MAIIKELPIDERPREKALRYGIENLSDAELLAIVLKSGYKGCSALSLASNLLDSFHGIYNVFFANEKELLQIKGINTVKLLEIKVVCQILLKLQKKESLTTPYIFSAKDVYQYYQASFSTLKQEKMLFLALNSKNRILKDELLFLGNEKEMVIDRRIICKKALDMNASKIILIHNHPSGDATPSFEDIEATKKILEALKLINIRLLDHVIIGNREYYSIIDQIKFFDDKV